MGCAWADHVGIGPDQGGYDSGVRTAVDCDELELSDGAPDWTFASLLIYWVKFALGRVQ